MSKGFEDVEREIRTRLEGLKTPADVEAFKVDILGKKGLLQGLMDQLKNLPPVEKPEFGQKVNQLKKSVEERIAALSSKDGSKASSVVSFDASMPPVFPKVGGIHPLSQTIKRISDIFIKMGFELADGPEVETEFFNFTGLNIPQDHPARDGFDTFYTTNGNLLRTQTSTVQVRVMQNRKPPLRIIAPGRVYRPDQVDASHSFMFHQIEGLLVDEKVTFADLKGTLHYFLRELFGKDIKVRFRPHFFPFTEPSVEVDIKWAKGWLEILGAGLVHPNVFDAVGYDTKRVQGFAFGLGVERITMLLHDIPDIRHFYENDLRFLRQFA